MIVVALCACILLYLHIADIQFDVNRDMSRADQSAYMNFTRRAHETDLKYTGSRNRMPLFPWIMTLAYAPEMTDQELFDAGKQMNVWLSVLILLVLGVTFFARFSTLYAAYATFAIAFLVFVLKSPYFQAELLFYGLFASAFVLALANLFLPTWRKSLVTGLLFALAHFTKASVLPVFLIYLGSFGVLIFIRLFRREGVRRHLLSGGTAALLSAFAFLAVLFPYLQESRGKYGSHFYNVNTTFYVWYDSWDEANAGTKAAGDREGYPDLPPEDIPGMEKYLREHTWQDILDRLRNGFDTLLQRSCTVDNSRPRFGYCSQVAAGLVLIALSLPLLFRRHSSREILDSGHIIFFIVATLVVYSLGAAWYIPIAGPSTRFLLVLAVPFFWTLGLVAHSRAVQQLRLKVGHASIKLSALLIGLLSLSLVNEIWQVLTLRAAAVYGGR